MRMIQCPNCEQLTGFKRALGVGTVLAVVFTAGFWLLAIPFYPQRCIKCGLTSVAARYSYDLRILVALAVAFVLVIALIFHVGTPPEGTSKNTEDGEQPIPNTVPASDVHPPAVPAGTRSRTEQDDELHLLPNYFGRGAVSDGRTYSVGVIVAHQHKIPPSTKLFVQGIIGSIAGPYSVSIVDEGDEQQKLICRMSPAEFQDVTYSFHLGDRTQAGGDYVSASSGVPMLENCRFSSPTETVVRPSQTSPQMGAKPEVAP